MRFFNQNTIGFYSAENQGRMFIEGRNGRFSGMRSSNQPITMQLTNYRS
jgi:hypothetical protein